MLRGLIPFVPFCHRIDHPFISLCVCTGEINGRQGFARGLDDVAPPVRVEKPAAGLDGPLGERG